MGKKIISVVCSVSLLFLITLLPGALPAWSAPGGKKQTEQGLTEKSIPNPEVSKPGEKGEKSVKKKVVTKAGKAAAAGVVGAKATSKVKETVKGSEK